jgi:hypothetical protein
MIPRVFSIWPLVVQAGIEDIFFMVLASVCLINSYGTFEEADDLSIEEVSSLQNQFFGKLGYGDPKWLTALAANELLQTATICAVLNNATQAVKKANKTLETLTPIKLKDLDETKQLESELQKLHSIVQPPR